MGFNERERAFVEWYPPRGYGVGFKVKRKLFEVQTEYQKLELYETEGFGKLLVLDGTVQLVERGGRRATTSRSFTRSCWPTQIRGTFS